ncbi:multidrug resistance efflux pump [Pseudomonas asplenii]|uniref:Multidrug resistance efflux pump n=2 Tax=Pseudomonas asplenii TaxID=53407 RepID=A0A0N0VK93_9PSED|nr:HlyD family secretion protein [Pseudomonas fuscovaginae]KPA91302.1 multidrug resistance efflux pump [Pseudomonas fuscovaginae]
MNTSISRKPLLILAVLLAGALLYGLWYLLLGGGPVQSTNDAYVNADYTLVAPKVAGFIGQVLVRDNQRVEAGQVLVRIDDQDYQADLAAARAGVASARAQLANAAASLLRQQALIEQARAVVDSDQADVQFAAHEWQRYQHLAGQGAGTLQNAQQAETRQRTAAARLAEHRAALEATRKQTDVLLARRDTAQAAVQQAEARQARAELDLAHTVLVAPFDGVVGRRSVRQGAYVKPGDVLLAVVPVNAAYVVGNFLENQMTHVSPGQSVSITVDTFADTPLTGQVESIAPATGVTFAAIAPENASGNFTKVVQRIPVKIVLDRGQPLLERLRPGMSVEARIDTASTAVREVSLR